MLFATARLRLVPRERLRAGVGRLAPNENRETETVSRLRDVSARRVGAERPEDALWVPGGDRARRDPGTERRPVLWLDDLGVRGDGLADKTASTSSAAT